LKEEAGGSRWKGKDGVVILYIFFEGRGQWELVSVKTGYQIVLLNEGRGQRELVGVKKGYETGRVS